MESLKLWRERRCFYDSLVAVGVFMFTLSCMVNRLDGFMGDVDIIACICLPGALSGVVFAYLSDMRIREYKRMKRIIMIVKRRP